MGKLSKVFSVILILVGGILILAWAGSGYAIDLYEEGIEENCDTTVGTIAQITDWDEGRCDEARENMDKLENYRPFILAFGTTFSVIGLIVLFRS
ncbi:MAG: hypothetical protein CMB75_02060 [Euryarchaeota archaeon]|nr:hypothetical protein [Euryarchaeota archaeon]|tara:strand:+ start:5007 stop:5291 length:285 start_codon:yes stop_codon:yes gene_type:complete